MIPVLSRLGHSFVKKNRKYKIFTKKDYIDSISILYYIVRKSQKVNGKFGRAGPVIQFIRRIYTSNYFYMLFYCIIDFSACGYIYELYHVFYHDDSLFSHQTFLSIFSDFA